MVASAAAAADALQVARSALADKLYEVATRQTLQALARSGTAAERSEALLIYLQILAEQERYTELLKVCDTHQATVSAGPAASFAYWRALALLATGEPAAALAAANQGLAAQPTGADDVALRRLSAKAQLALGNTADALAIYSGLARAVGEPQLNAAIRLDWVQTLEGLAKYSEAMTVLAPISLDSDGGLLGEQAALWRAQLLVRLQQNAEAAQALHALGANEHVDESIRVQALLDLTKLQLEGASTNDALVAARAASELARRPELRLLAGFRLGEILLSSTNTIAEGETRMKTLVREFSATPLAQEAQMRLAQALFAAKRYEQAAEAYQVFVESFGDTPDELAALTGRARALVQLNRFSEAANLYQKAHDHATNATAKAEYLYRAADAVVADGRYKQAAQLYRSVNQLYGATFLAASALFQAGDALERGGDLAAAEGLFRQTAERYTGTALAEQALLRLATLLSARNAVEAAIATYDAALAATTNETVRAAALLGRGRANYRAYRFEAALADFSGAAETAIGDGEADYWRIMSLYSLGRDDEAYHIGTSFRAKFPQAPRLADITLWLAKYDFNRGNMAEARTQFLQYAERWPDSPWNDAALLWAGRAAFNLDDFTSAVEILGRLCVAHPDSKRRPEGRFVQADALCELARFDEAVLLLNEIITRYPESDWVTPALGRRGDALFSMGVDNPVRFEEAIASYREMLSRRDLTPAMLLQGEFKIARCLEKLKRAPEAIEHYYTHVVLRFFETRRLGQADAEVAVWFSRAAFNAAKLLSQAGNNAAAARILRRVADSDVPGRAEARQRLEQLERERP